MKRKANPVDIDPLLLAAQREASFQYAREYEPITRGPVFAIAALLPLGCIMATCMFWRLLRRII
jgi:hypothetical protein